MFERLQIYGCMTSILHIEVRICQCGPLNKLKISPLYYDRIFAFKKYRSVPHKILINRLHSTFGFCGTVLEWFKSYLCGKTQCVVNGDFKLETLPPLRQGYLSQ